jgi:hypothetical protein
LLPGIDEKQFEEFVWQELFPKVQVLRRTIRATRHRLFKLAGTDASQVKYIWLVFVDCVGATPETAGQGPEILASDLPGFSEDWQLSSLFAPYAIISTSTEIVPGVQAPAG